MSHDMPDHGYAVSHAADLCIAAKQYLVLGLRVIALTGKAPNGAVHPHGLKDAITPSYLTLPIGERMLTDWFGHPKTTGIGILTGMPYYVVDIDGPEGAAAWKALVGEELYLPDRLVAKTGRGLHLWVSDWRQWPTTKLAEKLDFKGDGGYVAAPPSRHPDGHLYEWLLPPGDDTPMEMPDALLAVLTRKRREGEARALDRVTAKVRAPAALVDGLWYPVATFDGIINTVREEPEGNRNGVLYWAARTMLEQGADEEDLEELLGAATGSGLTHRESRRTIRSAIEAGRG